MGWGARIFFAVGFGLGAALLLAGLWIFLVARFPSPTVMVCGAFLLALTVLARHRHHRADLDLAM